MLCSLVSGTVLVLAYCAIVRAQLPTSAMVLRVPVWAWMGGVLGACFVATVIVATPKLGLGTLVGLTVTGQMVMAMLLDHYGLLGLEKHPISPGRLLGVAL